MSNKTINKKVLQTGTAIIWAGVLIGVSLLTDAESGALDWELMWVIIGGFLVHSILLNAFLKNHNDREEKSDV